MVEGAGAAVVLYHLEPGTSFEAHTHTFAELVVLLSGECRFTIADQERTLHEGDSLFLPPGTLHGVTVPRDRGPAVTLDVTVTTWTDLAPVSAAAVIRHAQTLARREEAPVTRGA